MVLFKVASVSFRCFEMQPWTTASEYDTERFCDYLSIAHISLTLYASANVQNISMKYYVKYILFPRYISKYASTGQYSGINIPCCHQVLTATATPWQWRWSAGSNVSTNMRFHFARITPGIHVFIYQTSVGTRCHRYLQLGRAGNDIHPEQDVWKDIHIKEGCGQH